MNFRVKKVIIPLILRQKHEPSSLFTLWYRRILFDRYEMYTRKYSFIHISTYTKSHRHTYNTYFLLT